MLDGGQRRCEGPHGDANLASITNGILAARFYRCINASSGVARAKSCARQSYSDGGQGKMGAIGAAEVSVDNYIKVVWDETTPAGTYYIVENGKVSTQVIGEFESPPGANKGRRFVPIDAPGPFIVAGDSGALNADRSIALCTRRGPTGDLGYHAATTSILGTAGTAVSSVIGPRRVGA